jgi:murein DD-endopeptidase MepM/ murein hydrolase activator NlpD
VTVQRQRFAAQTCVSTVSGLTHGNGFAQDSNQENTKLDNCGGYCLFQPDFNAASRAAVLGAPASLGRRLAAPDWRRILTRHDLRQRFGERLGLGHGVDLSVDLGDAIGSRQWWLGLAACTSLCGSALALGTLVPPIHVSTRPGLSPAQREALHPVGIAPLALGATTGITALPATRLVEPLAEAPERPRIELSASMNGRDGFDRVLRRAGVGQDDLAEVLALVRPVANIGALPRGTDVDIVLGRRDSKSVPRPLETLGFRAAFDLRLVLNRTASGLQLKCIPIAIDKTPLRLRGLVGRNLQGSLRSAGLPENLASEFTKTMGYAVDFQRGVGKNDRFDVVVERQAAETGEVRYGRLMFAGLERKGHDAIELGRFDFGGQSQFFKSDGESARKGLMRTPVDGARLTSGFGMRFHPLLAFSRMHQGVDFGASYGSPIYAAASGQVTYAAPHGGHGNYVMIKHNTSLSTAYGHMSRFAVRSGQSVAQGQLIGYVGSTGLSTGPHLHYEVWLNGKPTNPIALKFSGGTQLSGNNLYSFLAEMSHWRSLAATGTMPAGAVGLLANAREAVASVTRRHRHGR